MPRIPYKPRDTSEPKDVVDAIRKRRGGTLLELDRMLLHSPPIARGWNEYLGAVRRELGLPAKLRELAIIGVGVLNGAEYEVLAHAPEFRADGGTQDQLAALYRYAESAGNDKLFDAQERAVMRLTTEMTRNVKVSDATFAEVERQFPDPQRIMELVGTIAAYNMVSRVIVALGIEQE